MNEKQKIPPINLWTIHAVMAMALTIGMSPIIESMVKQDERIRVRRNDHK